MTAHRVVDEHCELGGIGQTTHEEIDTHISGSEFLVLSSSTKIPPVARELCVGEGLLYDDGGPQGKFCLYVDPAFLSGSTGVPDDAEYVVLSPDVDLPNAKILITGSGIDITTSGSTITVSVDKDFVHSLIVWNEIPSGNIDGFNSIFSLANSPSGTNNLQLFVNGVLQCQPGDYSLIGSTVNMTWTPRSGSNLLASYPRIV